MTRARHSKKIGVIAGLDPAIHGADGTVDARVKPAHDSEKESRAGNRTLASAHSFPVRVYYEDTDAAGIVYYANYLKFAERARTEMLRMVGIDQRSLEEQTGVSFAVRRCSVEYLAPARLDDMLEVRTRITGLSGAAIEAEQIVRRDANDLARLNVMLACRDRRGRATRLPRTVRDALNRFTESKQ